MRTRKQIVAAAACCWLITLSPLTTAHAEPTGGPPSPTLTDFPANPIGKDGWQVVASDEFDGTAGPGPLWQRAYLPHWTTPGLATPNLTQSDGRLSLRITKEQQPWEPTRDGQTVVSSIATANKNWIHNWAPYKQLDHSEPTVFHHAQKYGYFELRAKAQAGSGHHAAWWMVGTQPDQGTSDGVTRQNAEIDVFEILGKDRTRAFFNLHPLADSKLTSYSTSVDIGADLTAGYHVYGLEWAPGSLRLFIDNKLVRTVAQAPDYPMLTMLGLYEKRAGGWTGPLDPTIAYPKSFDIDYWRAYQKPPTFPYRLEAEDADVYGQTRSIEDTGASGGRRLGWLGGGPANHAEHRYLYAPADGTYRLTLRYRSSEDRALTYAVNGGAPTTLTRLNSGDWRTWKDITVSVPLKKGYNSLRLSGANGYTPDLDTLTVS